MAHWRSRFAADEGSIRGGRAVTSLVRDHGLWGGFCLLLYEVGLDRRLCGPRWSPQRFRGFPISTVSVDPAAIEYEHRFPVPVTGHEAELGVGGGSWDRFRRDIADTRVFRSLSQHFIDEVEWRRTPAYGAARLELRSGRSSWHGCQTIEELHDRCEQLDALYETIEAEGYCAQADLPEGERNTIEVAGRTVPDEPCIAIGRNGELIRCREGRHRVAMARLLDIDEIPVNVQLVHREFAEQVPIERPLARGTRLYTGTHK